MVFSFLGLTDKTFQLTRSIFILQQCPKKVKSTVFEILFLFFLAELPQLLSFVVEFESKENSQNNFFPDLYSLGNE